MRSTSPGEHFWRCRRCGAQLQPGRGDFYVVKVEAVADPHPPVFSEEDLQRDHAAAIDAILVELRKASEQELMAQVYQRVDFCLCLACYRTWMQRPWQ